MKVTMKKTMIILLKFKNNLFFQVYIYIHIFYCLALLVQSSQDLCLLSSDEMKTILTSEEVEKLKALLVARGIELIPPKSLVGKWVDVDGIGPGRVRGYKKVTNSLLYDSQHIIDFSISGGSSKEKILLRRRKLFKWNHGIRYHLLGDKPSPKYVEKSLADEEAKLHSAVQSRKLLNDLQESETGEASFLLSTHGNLAIQGVLETMEEDDEEGSRTRSSSSAMTSPIRPSQTTPSDDELFSFSFDLRQLNKILGPSASFVHVTFRFAQRYSFATPPTDVPINGGGGGSNVPNLGGMAMCEWSTLEHWATEQAYRGYDVSNPYHNALHATDVALTANAYLDACGALGAEGANPHMRWWWHRYALMLAALCHDLGHPARMNPFMIATKSALTLEYLEQGGGVLELMHVAKFNETLRLPGCNVLERLGAGAGEGRMKETITQLILATDLGKQGDILGTWNAAAETGLTLDGDPTKVTEDRLLLLKVIVKGADVSNPAKPLPVYLHWTEKILEEFYDQGDEEKRLGLPVTSMPQCDRTQPAVPAGQKGFIAFVVRPIFSALAEFEKSNGRENGSMHLALDNLDNNLAFWKKVEKEVPKEALSLARLPSDLPLYDLAPEEMAGEMEAAAELEAANEKEYEKQQMILIENVLQQEKVVTQQQQPPQPYIESSSSSSSSSSSTLFPSIIGGGGGGSKKVIRRFSTTEMAEISKVLDDDNKEVKHLQSRHFRNNKDDESDKPESDKLESGVNI